MNRRLHWLLMALLVPIAVSCIAFVATTQLQRAQWYALRDRQWAMIERLNDHRPRDVTTHGWHEAIMTVYNVWGNVIHRPQSATLTEMQEFQRNLDQILSETTRENVFSCVDEVFLLLLNHQPGSSFIQRYREAFRQFPSAYNPHKLDTELGLTPPP